MRNMDYSNYFWQDEAIRLRAIALEDWESCYESAYDTPARRFLECAIELPPTISEAKKFTEENADFSSTNRRIMFTIETLNGDIVGGINLNSIDERNGTFSIGIVIDHPYRGKGHGTRALHILLNYAFFERRLHKFNDYVLEGNEASAAMLRKVGCVQEGIRRQVFYTNGRYHDSILYGLTKDEYHDYLSKNHQTKKE
ncbi:GNAT family N-acetyltransferase [Paenibacillus methanolicus]|uniref:RimJ/RimL family protein N-acetyltransferase n=1 Tax=Paenibacillus methanolicus TaxID=582686 RepID=A0A5S5BY45_9BACL|nr:GNAT family protein [Paenibacillus methanolicus]TYP72085.1 RimJ/RimL family protein N-acetyltransferase [Paenibacillus methanolicus]